MLAGISSDYYLRLEQGRDRNPSMQVLEALARVLQLDLAATDYLLELAAPKPRHRQPRPRREQVTAGIRSLLDVIGLPALFTGATSTCWPAIRSPRRSRRTFRLGTTGSARYFSIPRKGLLSDWTAATARFVAGFRESVGRDTDDPRVFSWSANSLSSERFRKLWARHDIRTRAGGPTRLNHPQLGDLTLRGEKLAIGGSAGQILVVFNAEPASSSAEKLALLGSLASATVESAEGRSALKQ